MHVIRTYSIGRAHELAIDKVIKKGSYIKTQDNEETIELNEPLNVFVSKPLSQPLISSKNKFGINAMKGYTDQLLNGTNNEFVYNYHDRIFAYPQFVGKPLDQIHELVEELKAFPTSRRAQAITWIPAFDNYSDNPPCLQRIQFLLRNNKLNMNVDFRSRDILSAMGANMYAFVALQLMVADKLGVDVGWYSDTSISAHIYFKRDMDELMKYFPYESAEDFCMKLRN